MVPRSCHSHLWEGGKGVRGGREQGMEGEREGRGRDGGERGGDGGERGVGWGVRGGWDGG